MNAQFSNWQACSAKHQVANILGFMSQLVSSNSVIVVYSSPLNSATVEENQPQSICKQMSMNVFQQHLFYKNRWWVRFGPWTIVGLIPDKLKDQMNEKALKSSSQKEDLKSKKVKSGNKAFLSRNRRKGVGTTSFPCSLSGNQE